LISYHNGWGGGRGNNDLLEAILGTDRNKLNTARARVLASKGKGEGDIPVVADVEKEVKRTPQRAISFDGTDLATVVAGTSVTAADASRPGPSASWQHQS